MKKLSSTLALILATSIYLALTSAVCLLTYNILNLDEALCITLNFGHWLAIVIITKTLFIDSQLIFANKNKKDDNQRA
jgi:hypothetical protein